MSTQAQPTEELPATSQELTPQEANRIAHALAQLHTLEDAVIATPTSDAQKKGLREFIANSFLKHAGTFLGCYFTVKGEYEVLVNALALAFRRVDGIRNQMAIQEAAHRAAVKAEQEKSAIISKTDREPLVD
jgi:DNA phosphorothioation-dependent restriction protein DptG